MKASTLLFKIESNMDQFSPAEKKVAMYIMENAEIVPNLTTKEVSTNAGASEASVVRFCKSIGIGSFKAFKIALVRELTIADYNINDFSVMNTEDGPYDLFNKVTYVNKAAIEASVTAIDKKELEKAADHIVNADKIIFYGVGGSATPAMDGAYKFTRLGFTAMMLSDFHMMLPLVTNLKKAIYLWRFQHLVVRKMYLKWRNMRRDRVQQLLRLQSLINHHRYIKRRIFVFVCQM